MLDTSGLMLSKNRDGSMRIEYVDYDTPLGGDYESMYDLDKENAKLLEKLMKKLHPNLKLKAALIAEVGEHLSDRKLQKLLSENNIKYSHYTWLG